MKTLRTRLALSLTAIAAISASPASAATVEGAVVPPSNSAATQYTETFPTTGGDKKTDEKSSHSPTKVLGSHNTKKLEKQGPEGKAAAEVAAATAPTSIATPPAATPAPSTQGNDGGKHSGGAGGNSKGDSGTGNGGASAPKQGSNPASGSETVRPPAPEPAGSSGIGSAIGQATGLSTSGQSGMLLPLMILATILWSLAYLRRQRQRVD